MIKHPGTDDGLAPEPELDQRLRHTLNAVAATVTDAPALTTSTVTTPDWPRKSTRQVRLAAILGAVGLLSARRWTGRLALAGVGAAAVAGALVLSLGSNGAGPSSAQSVNAGGSNGAVQGAAQPVNAGYTITTSGDKVTILWRDTRKDPVGLERKLNDLGIRAEVDYEPAGKMCQHPRYTNVNSVTGIHGAIQHITSPTSGFTIDKTRVAGYTVVIEEGPGTDVPDPSFTPKNTPNSYGRGRLSYVPQLSVGVAAGKVKPCELVPATTWQDPVNDEDSNK